MSKEKNNKVAKDNSSKNIHSEHRNRHRERAEREGIEGFREHEVLEYILFPLIPRKDTNALAHRLIKEFGSLENVLTAAEHELVKQSGISSITAKYLNFITQITPYMQKIKSKEMTYITTPESAANYIMPYLANEVLEKLYLFSLDINYKLLSLDLLTSGSPNAVSVNIPKVASIAMKKGANFAVLAHNHPAGSLYPSRNDLEMTERITMALASCGVHLVDHVIIANNSFVSIDAYTRDSFGDSLFFKTIATHRNILSRSFICENPHTKNLVWDENLNDFFRENGRSLK